MPKKATLAKHYSSLELKQKYLKSKDKVESRRWHLLWKVSLGWTIKNSAFAVGINYDYAKEIVSKYNDLALRLRSVPTLSGVEGLGEKGVENLKNKYRQHKGAKKSLLTELQLEKLAYEGFGER